MNSRGFTLVETAIAVAIALALLLAGVPLVRGAHAAAAITAASQFDAAVAYAKALAGSSGNGATLVVANGTLTVYSGRPTSPSALTLSGMAPTSYAGTISEASLGATPLTIFFDTIGDASAMSGAIAPGTIVSSDPGCPSGETQLQLRISDARTTLTRSLACAN